MINSENQSNNYFDTYDAPVGYDINGTQVNFLTPNNERGNDKVSRTLLASVVASLASILLGYTMGYTSPTQNEIEKELLSTVQFSWFASLVAIGAIIGCLIGGFMTEKLGRKTTIMLLSLLHTPGWCLICYADNPLMLYFGRLLTGVGVGIASLVVPLYIGEISSARLRGGLSLINQLFINFGVLIAYLVGFRLPWRWAAILPVMLSAILVLLMAFMPESPRWLLANNKRHKALLVLAQLRGRNYDFEEECFQIESSLDQQYKMTIADFKNPAMYRPTIICSMLMIFQQLSGINAIILYCTKIFDIAGFNYPKAVSVAVAVTLIVFTVVACLIVDKSGRRILLISGGLIMFLCQFILGLYFDLVEVEGEDNKISIFGKFSHKISSHHFSVLALLCIFVYIAVFSIGWGPLPWLLMSELLPPKARGTFGSIVALLYWVFVFITTNLFHELISTLFVQGTFWLFAGFSILSFLFTLFYLPETKGKTLEEIEEMFAER